MPRLPRLKCTNNKCAPATVFDISKNLHALRTTICYFVELTELFCIYTDYVPQSATLLSQQNCSVSTISFSTFHSFQRLDELHQQVILQMPTAAALLSNIP